MAPDTQVIWDDEPGGNVEHVSEHGLTPDEVDDILFGSTVDTASHATGRPCKCGWTTTGRHIIVIWDVVSEDPPIIMPVIAYDVPKRN
ncbi:MAG: hypothetical protein ACRC7O_04140 [Fimbriiglobus sp.]